MPHRLVFPGPKEVCYEEFALPALGAGEVQVQTIVSHLSTGTEGIVFARNFAPDTNWAKWVKYPFYPGYATVGRVTASTAPEFAAGTLVVHRKGHCSAAVVPADECCAVPAGVSPDEAAWFALAKIGAMGARAGLFGLGRGVLIIGAGPVGQMATRWAAAAGCLPVIVADPVAQRLEHARQGGATHTVAAPIDQAREAILAAGGGQLPETVVDATGNAVVFSHALTLARNRGRVVILGDTGFPTEQRLTTDVINRGLQIIGAHDCHEDPDWTAQKLYRLFLHLVAAGRFPVAQLITHRFAPTQAAEVYHFLGERRAETMGVAFTW
jgi:2-desacetyl-2-hydroxyethyl bacteriochlorophyllide A dehydrogenase